MSTPVRNRSEALERLADLAPHHDLQDELARMLGRPVDLVTPAAIKERMRARIEREAGDAV